MNIKEMLELNFEERMLENLLDCQNAFVEASRRFALFTEIHDRLTASPDMLDADDMEYLLLFENPLEIIADYMEDRMNDFADLDDVLAEVFEDDQLASKYNPARESEDE